MVEGGRGRSGASGTVVAVVPAAGSGERLAAGVPKAFYQLEGQTLVERAVDGLLDIVAGGARCVSACSLRV